MYPQITLDDGRTFTHLAQIFDRGLKVAGLNAPYIGHRPTISTDPLRFAKHFVWSTWGEVAKRRLNVGSGVENIFCSGGAVKANGLETVGLWSANTPGEFAFHMPPSRSLWRLTSHHLTPFHSLVILAEWRILDLALSLYGKVIVPLYENFGPDSIGAPVPSSYPHFQPTTQKTCLKSTCRFLGCKVVGHH